MGSKKFWFVSAALFAITFAGLLLLNDWRRLPKRNMLLMRSGWEMSFGRAGIHPDMLRPIPQMMFRFPGLSRHQ